MKWSKAWSIGSGVGTVLLALCVAGGVTGCSKKKDEDAKAQAEKDAKRRPEGDRYADGQRLAATLKDWTRRWSETQDLPPCDPLLKDPAELELCKTAGTALSAMKAAAAKPEPEAVLVHDAAELAFATETASEKLRNASMERMQAEQKAAPVPSGSGAAKLPQPPKAPPPPLAYSASSKVRGLSSVAKSALAEQLRPIDATVDPAMQVMQAYSRANRAALRYLSQFLQFGPLPMRKATFAELEALSKRKEAWPALGRTLREAAMAENDPELQSSLKTLAPKLSRRAVAATPQLLGAPPAGGPPPGAAPPPKGE